MSRQPRKIGPLLSDEEKSIAKFISIVAILVVVAFTFGGGFRACNNHAKRSADNPYKVQMAKDVAAKKERAFAKEVAEKEKAEIYDSYSKNYNLMIAAGKDKNYAKNYAQAISEGQDENYSKIYAQVCVQRSKLEFQTDRSIRIYAGQYAESYTWALSKGKDGVYAHTYAEIMASTKKSKELMLRHMPR